MSELKQQIEKKVVEKLAELEHERWSHWLKYQLSRLGGDEYACVKEWSKWKKQSETSYSNLSEKEKESDREWVRKVLKILVVDCVCIPRKQLEPFYDNLKKHTELDVQSGYHVSKERKEVLKILEWLLEDSK